MTDRAPSLLVSGVVLSQPAGGVRRHNQQLLPRLAGLLAGAGGRMAILEGAAGIPFDLPESVERIPSSVPAGPPPRRAVSEGRALGQAIEAARTAGRPFDLLHTAHLPVPRALPIPYTLTQHDLRQLEIISTPFVRRLFASGIIGRALRNAAGIFVVSETVRTEILLRYRLDPQGVRVVSNAADHFQPGPRDYAQPGRLLALGHVEPRKNLGLILEALALDPALPSLQVAGRAKGDEQARLEQRARELGVEARVHFSGPFEDEQLPQLYSQAACVVLPSHIEGFGIVALEAQRARVPLAISSAGALLEVAGEGVPSFAPDDPASCAAALAHALEQPADVLARHAARADRFTWDASAQAWFEGLCAVLAGTGSAGR
ncbi:MAG: glycosyltransferase involved in cell wall biosynthesis [Chlamydiales bacterium]|jgi:glycosyltransferase involved in cell wall biosynthesis